MSTREQVAMLDSLEQAANIVAIFTGIKAQYVGSGWSEAGAEAMVVEMMRNTNK